MAINTTAGLLDAIVLAVVGREETGTYGYKITQEVRTVLDLSESTLYPLLSNHARRPRPAGRIYRRVGSLHHKNQQAL